MAEVQAGLFELSWPEADMAALLEPAPSVSYVALEGGRCIGFLLGRVVADEAEILSIGVDQRVQRRGLGRKMLKHWLAEIREAGAKRAFLEVAAENVAASALYRAAGFEVTGRRNGYYHRRDGTTGDALMMMLDLCLA